MRRFATLGLALIVGLTSLGFGQTAKADGFDPYEIDDSGVWIRPNYTFPIVDDGNNRVGYQIWIYEVESGAEPNALQAMVWQRRRDNGNSWEAAGDTGCWYDISALEGTTPDDGFVIDDESDCLDYVDQQVDFDGTNPTNPYKFRVSIAPMIWAEESASFQWGFYNNAGACEPVGCATVGESPAPAIDAKFD